MTHNCESCGMPIENGRYCQYCVDETGVLQDFDTRFGRMVDWQLREQGGELRLANLNDDLQTLFELTKLDTLFQISDTRERALESF